MSSQDDLGMLWYGVSGVSFNPTDPSEVMLNTGITAPLLSDHPRALVAPQVSQTSLGSHPHQAALSYGDPSISQNNQMLYDPQTGDFINHADYMYETYDGYEEDSSGANGISGHNHQLLANPQHNHGEEEVIYPKTKKPKVHQHPALKLKTPIAYQKDTDLNAIPIMKEGMAVCEKCGAIGVKHAFYGKERKFCSLACARPPMPNTNIPSKVSSDLNKFPNRMNDSSIELNNEHEDEKINLVTAPFTFHPKKEDNLSSQLSMESRDVSPYDFESGEKCPSETFNTITSSQSDTSDFLACDNVSFNKCSNSCSSNSLSSSPSPRATPTYLPPPGEKEILLDSFDWESSYLNSEGFTAAPVKSFKHAPMNECWEQVTPGMKVEVSCGEESIMKDAFWVATVVKLCGYKANLRFEGFVDDNSKDFWVDLCSEEVHPVGWCATQGKPLIPPKSIQYKYNDWKEFLMKRLTGARTLPTNFHSKVTESLKSRFRPGLNLEVVDKNRIAQMRVATVTKVIGKRLHLRYHGAPPVDNGFWCHEDAAIIHPVGWSREVGHEIVASQSYHEKCLEVAYDPDDATSDLFVYPNRTAIISQAGETFAEGMKLEAIDPLNLATVCVATVMKVLSHNYLMIRIDSYDSDNTCSDWFCYHAASTSIFPAGFCEMNDITLTPPRGYEGQFSWYDYLTKTKAIPAPPSLFTRDVPKHGFKIGMSIEATDLMDPRLVCVANIKEIKGRLLKIHFDGWEDDFDQWVDCHSSDIYPVGWCNLVSYKLEGPRLTIPAPFIHRKKVRGRGSRKRSFASRRGSFNGKGTENITPLNSHSPTTVQMMPLSSKRGRRPRQRGSSSMNQHLRESNSGTAEFIFEQDSSNDLSYGANETSGLSGRGRKGRTRKNPTSSMHHRPMRTTRTVLSSYAQSEDDASDETSSGVASLVGSENSSEAWDMDQYGITPLQEVQDVSNPSEREGSLKNINNQNFMGQLTPISNDTDYRENIRPQSLNFKTISDESVLFGDESPTLDSFFTSTGDKLVESLHMSDNSSDFQVSSSLELPLNNQSLTSANCNLSTASVISSSEDNWGTASASNPQSPSPPPPTLSSHSDDDVRSEDANLASIDNANVNLGSVNTGACDKHFIPRLTDNSHVLRGGKVQPKLWSHHDVASFLKANDCGAYCGNFIAKEIDGSRLLTLAQNEVMELTGMKVGPSLKIHDLIQQLLAIVNPAQARYQATLLKRGLSFGKT